jgi:hypothetical protein
MKVFLGKRYRKMQKPHLTDFSAVDDALHLTGLKMTYASKNPRLKSIIRWRMRQVAYTGGGESGILNRS